MEATEIMTQINSKLHSDETTVTAVAEIAPNRYRVTLAANHPAAWKAAGRAAYEALGAYLNQDAKRSFTGTMKIR